LNNEQSDTVSIAPLAHRAACQRQLCFLLCSLMTRVKSTTVKS